MLLQSSTLANYYTVPHTHIHIYYIYMCVCVCVCLCACCCVCVCLRVPVWVCVYQVYDYRFPILRKNTWCRNCNILLQSGMSTENGKERVIQFVEYLNSTNWNIAFFFVSSKIENKIFVLRFVYFAELLNIFPIWWTSII